MYLIDNLPAKKVSQCLGGNKSYQSTLLNFETYLMDRMASRIHVIFQPIALNIPQITITSMLLYNARSPSNFRQIKFY